MNDPDHRQPLLCFLAGMALSVMGYSFYSHFEKTRPAETTPSDTSLHTQRDSTLEDDIPLHSLIYLVNSTHATIQSCSVKVAIERAMSERYLLAIITACQKDQPISLRSQALTVLQLLTQTEKHRPALLKAGALNVLVDGLASKEPDMTELTQRYVAMAICDLIQGSDTNKYNAIDLGILDSIHRILTSTMTQKNELKYWTLMILHQISLSDPFPKALVVQGFVGLLAAMARATFGNTNMPKFCMQSLVRLVASVDTIDSKIVLLELLEFDIVDLISVCLRADDIELIYWAAGLMHEFVLKDVATDQFRAIKDIHNILAGLLSAEEMYISRVVLRTIKFMVYGQDAFRQNMVESNIMKKIMQCLNLEDDDVRYWATLCIHAVASQVESHKDILSASEFNILLELAVQQKLHAAPFVADILTLICCIWHNDVLLDNHLDNVASTLNTLLSWEEVEVQYNAASALFNVAAMRDSFAAVVRDKCWDNLLSVCILSTHERVQVSCAKVALLLTIKFPNLKSRLIREAVEPLIDTCITMNQQVLPIMMMQSVLAARHHGRLSVDLEPFPSSSRASTGTDMLTSASLLDNLAPLFDQPAKERVSTLSQFRLPLPTQTQLAGAIYALRYFLENDTIMASVVAGVSNSSRSTSTLPMMHLDTIYTDRPLDSGGEGDDDEDEVYVSPLSIHQQEAANMVYLTSPRNDDLPEDIQQLVDGLVYQALYPVIGHWWVASSHRHISVDRLTSSEFQARQMFPRVLEWVYREAQLVPRSTPSTTSAVTFGSPRLTDNSSMPRSILNTSTHLASDAHTITGSTSSFSPSSSSASSSDDDDDDRTSYDSDREDRKRHRQQTIQHDMFSRHIESAEERYVATRRAGELLDDNSRMPYQRKKGAWMDNKVYTGLTTRALLALRSLLRFDNVRRYLVHHLHFVEMMIYMLQHTPSLTDHLLTCLGVLINTQTQLPDETLKRCMTAMWRHLLDPTTVQKQKKTFKYYSSLLMTCGSCMVSNGEHYRRPDDDNAAFPFVCLDVTRSTLFCLINQDNRLEARNDSWTFETVVATHSVSQKCPGPLRYCYQVKLKTAGLLQIGWINEHGHLDAEAGSGIGDDENSYGYDGYRRKKWYGRYHLKNTLYGTTWQTGDVITCSIDLDVGEIRYYQNGEDLGAAFTKVDRARTWYPALSLSVGQGCEFYFGGPLDPLSNIPGKCSSVYSANFDSFLGQTTAPTSPYSQGSDGVNGLTAALQDMHLTSPLSTSPLSVQTQSNDLDPLSVTAYAEMRIAFKADSPSSVIAIGWKNALAKMDVALVYNLETCHATVCVHANDMLPDPLPMTLKNGDTIGLFHTEQNQIGFTLNGRLLHTMSLQTPFAPYLAFFSGPMYAKINYGQDPFVFWQQGNHPRSRKALATFLDESFGKKS